MTELLFRLDMEVYRAMRLVFPDPVVLLISILGLAYLSRWEKQQIFQARRAIPEEPIEEQTETIPPESELSTGFIQPPEVPRVGRSPPPVATVAFPNIWMLNLTTVVLVGAAGLIVPSLLYAFYLIGFYFTCTYWSSCKTVYYRKLVWSRITLLIYSAFHLCLLYLYQFQFAQLILQDGSFTARLLGLNYILRSDCTCPGEIIFPSDKPLFVFFAPLMTLFVYLSVAVELVASDEADLHGGVPKWILLRNLNLSSPSSRHSLLQQQRDQNSMDDNNHHEPSTSLNEPLLQNTNQSAGNNVILVDSRRSHSEQANGNLPLIDLDDPPTTETIVPIRVGEPEIPLVVRPVSASILTGRSQPVYDVFPFMVAARYRHKFSFDGHFIVNDDATFSPLTQRPLLLSFLNSAIRNSYILTFIAMMAWSVIFRSWLSFILLLSACFLWILPNSRLACLYCSPLIVAYGMVIIILQYIYSFDLTESELPTYIPDRNLNLTEIGLHRWPIPVWPLSLQVPVNAPFRLTEGPSLFFMVFFWLNLRLFVLERSSNRSGVNSSENNNSGTTTVTAPGLAALAGSGGGAGTVEEGVEVTATTSNEYGGIAVVDNVRYRKFSKLANVT
ncbi:unnamed protein product [Rodentolepis nana]|uniref:Piezo-type mechanosensitive ion channel component n=1 Tax=Rodentolepis nana TaxID=102285 RepID=A0A158QJ81_RODNA|nr:unnamed protein product [Rodentolepis nana]